jgi:hypothetical protein
VKALDPAAYLLEAEADTLVHLQTTQLLNSPRAMAFNNQCKIDPSGEL